MVVLPGLHNTTRSHSTETKLNAPTHLGTPRKKTNVPSRVPSPGRSRHLGPPWAHSEAPPSAHVLDLKHFELRKRTLPTVQTKGQPLGSCHREFFSVSINQQPPGASLTYFTTGRNPVLIRHFRRAAALPRSFLPVTSIARGEPDMPPFVYTGHAAPAMAPYPVLHRIDKPSVSDMHAAPIALCVAGKDEHGPLQRISPTRDWRTLPSSQPLALA
ncbi:hypothetical protein CSOJ01_05929 [Colletotrichum sojae]|uniref:Uncharacterized protein n=1 Tax=Colletotrichum sojae TaxID=2175907 RepID=A0A8H6JDH6_9PEZI|nr:hypothetical protein CSOJ01_05929 [Colletotrichum sojae]